MSLSVVTLFAGAGGADIGLSRAGFRHLACVEGDAHACATLTAAGFPAVHAWIGDRQPERRAKGKVLPPLPTWAHTGERPDMMWLSPPCQPFSRAGAQLGAEDERDGWPASLEAIRTVRPRWVIVENVVGAPVDAWADTLRPFYPWVAVWRADAVDWGLPSHRDRLYVVAGPRPIEWPRPTHYGPRVPWLLRGGKRPWVSFGEALGLVGAVRAAKESTAHLPVRDREEQIISGPSQCIGAAYSGKLGWQPHVTFPVMESRRGREGGSQWEATEADSPATCIRTAAGGSSLPRITLLPGNGGNIPAPRPPEPPAHTVASSVRHYIDVVRAGDEAHRDYPLRDEADPAPTIRGRAGGFDLLSAPSPCVCATEQKGHTNPHLDRGSPSPVNRASDALFLSTGRRALTPAECAILCGFPADYPFQGPKYAHYRQIGNCVAPVMAEVLGRAILAAERGTPG